MIVNMAFVNMGRNDKLIPTFCHALGQFATYPVGVLRGNFPRLERLPDMIGQHFFFTGRLVAAIV